MMTINSIGGTPQSRANCSWHKIREWRNKPSSYQLQSTSQPTSQASTTPQTCSSSSWSPSDNAQSSSYCTDNAATCNQPTTSNESTTTGAVSLHTATTTTTVTCFVSGMFLILILHFILTVQICRNSQHFMFFAVWGQQSRVVCGNATDFVFFLV